MNWLRQIGQLEYILILLFVIFYIGYLIRLYLISKKIKISIRRIMLKLFLRSAYFALFIIALLGPSFGDIKKEIKTIGKDIYLCVDLSKSMDATDINPSRLEKVKFELKNIIHSFNSDRIGMIVFSNEAYVQCPLTHDMGALKIFVETLDTKILSNAGTDLASALSLAYKKLSEEKKTAEESNAKVMILITDGENFGETSMKEVLNKISSDKISFFILGIGTVDGGKIPVDFGYKKDVYGKDVISRVEPEELKNIATQAGGKYYEINKNTNEVKPLINEVNRIEGTMRDGKKIDSAANKYFYFLFIGLVLLFIDVLITIKTIKI